MSHGITGLDNMVAQVVEGDATRMTPWHRLGINVTDAQSFDDVVKLIPALGEHTFTLPAGARMPDGTFISSDDRYYTAKRLPNGIVTLLGEVSSVYTSYDDAEAYEVGTEIVKQSQNAAIIETAGTLHGMRKSWFAIRLPGEIKVGGIDNEQLITYLVILNSHDGTGALRYVLTTVRVVCANTYAMADGSAHKWVARHTPNLRDKVSEARDVLKISFDALSEIDAIANRLFDTKIDTDADARGLLESAGLATRLIERSITAYTTTADLQPIRGTRWGLAQAVAEAFDHNIIASDTGKMSAAERLSNKSASVLFGEGGNPKDALLKVFLKV